jgi:uncharacterized DUF497 family protein
MPTPRPQLTWDDQSRHHIARHGVRTEDVEHLLGRVEFVRRGRKGYRCYYGQDAGGRYLMVVLDSLGGGVYYVVTARPMNDSERRLYRHRLRRRG